MAVAMLPSRPNQAPAALAQGTNRAKKNNTNNGAVSRLTSLKQRSNRLPSMNTLSRLSAIATKATSHVIRLRRRTASASDDFSVDRLDTKSRSRTAQAEFTPEDKLDNAAER